MALTFDTHSTSFTDLVASFKHTKFQGHWSNGSGEEDF